MAMLEQLLDKIDDLESCELIQQLWSGYGKILRVPVSKESFDTVVVKHVCPPDQTNHPRGWNSDIGHQRKLKSYQVETCWYQNWSVKNTGRARVPECLAYQQKGDEVFLVLEDLDASGFPVRLQSVEWRQIEICLEWLAEFHAAYLGEVPEGIWATGTYWHLETRPDELEVLSDIPLKNAAQAIDDALKSARYQTFVHGDAKLANFCFSADCESVAAVDFQYVGGGCGMKDVAYFIGSCLDEISCEKLEAKLLDTYFNYLKVALQRSSKEVDIDMLVEEWRGLFPVAWTDFHRFLKGWCPEHWKVNSYSERLAKEVVKKLAS